MKVLTKPQADSALQALSFCNQWLIVLWRVSLPTVLYGGLFTYQLNQLLLFPPACIWLWQRAGLWISHTYTVLCTSGTFFFKRLPWIIQPEMIVVLYPAESSRKYSLTCLRNALRFSLILIRRINAKCISRLQCTLWDGKSLSTKSRFHQENYSRGWGSFPHPPTQSELSQTILILKLSVASYGKKKKSYLGKYHSKALVNLY